MRLIIPAAAVLACALSAAPALADLGDLAVPTAGPLPAPAEAAARAQEPTLWTHTFYEEIPPDAGTHRLVLWCDGDALLYSISLYVPGGGNVYMVNADSIRLNGQALNHQGHFVAGDLRADLLRSGPVRLDVAPPLALSGYGSLMVPVIVSGEGAAARAMLDVTYVSGRQTSCGLDSFDPSAVGAFYPADGFGDLMRTSVGVGIEDFNGFLEWLDAGWSMGTVEVPTGNATEAVTRLEEAGIRSHLGFPAIAGLTELGSLAPDHLAVACCPTTGTMDKADRLFRTAPSDTVLGAHLAKLMLHNGMDVLLPVWRSDDIWTVGYRDAVVDAFFDMGGRVDSGVAETSGDLDMDLLAARVADRITMLVEAYGADRVAVFVSVYDEPALLESISKYEELRQVRWFGPDYDYGNVQYTTGDVAGFASDVGYTVLQVRDSGFADEVRLALRDATGRLTNHDMLAAYESAWLLGLAMLHAQSSDPDRLAEAVPHVGARYSGTLGPMALDANGDLAVDSFEVWSVRDGKWALAGVME